jgi:hypothetical protein
MLQAPLEMKGMDLRMHFHSQEEEEKEGEREKSKNLDTYSAVGTHTSSLFC